VLVFRIKIYFFTIVAFVLSFKSLNTFNASETYMSFVRFLCQAVLFEAKSLFSFIKETSYFGDKNVMSDLYSKTD